VKERGRPELRDDVEIGEESRRKGGDMHNRCIMYFNSLQFSYYKADHLIVCVCAKINGQFPWLSIELNLELLRPPRCNFFQFT
jgi:hypothetical protein